MRVYILSAVQTDVGVGSLIRLDSEQVKLIEQTESGFIVEETSGKRWLAYDVMALETRSEEMEPVLYEDVGCFIPLQLAGGLPLPPVSITNDGDTIISYDFSHLEMADDGNTVYYGGEVEIAGKTYQVKGNDRSGGLADVVIEAVEEAIGRPLFSDRECDEIMESDLLRSGSKGFCVLPFSKTKVLEDR